MQPDYSRAFRNRGDAYRKKGDRDHTIADYREALSFKPDEALRKEIQACLMTSALELVRGHRHRPAHPRESNCKVEMLEGRVPIIA
jgi:tetratricopeptide (TPR) repeat protein